MYYQCKFTSPMCCYSTDFYDLHSNDEDEIRTEIESRGFEVDEIYDIREQ